jgi:hypothetical protein
MTTLILPSYPALIVTTLGERLKKVPIIPEENEPFCPKPRQNMLLPVLHRKMGKKEQRK